MRSDEIAALPVTVYNPPWQEANMPNCSTRAARRNNAAETVCVQRPGRLEPESPQVCDLRI